jgi:hypothetical protein
MPGGCLGLDFDQARRLPHPRHPTARTTPLRYGRIAQLWQGLAGLDVLWDLLQDLDTRAGLSAPTPPHGSHHAATIRSSFACRAALDLPSGIAGHTRRKPPPDYTALLGVPLGLLLHFRPISRHFEALKDARDELRMPRAAS